MYFVFIFRLKFSASCQHFIFVRENDDRTNKEIALIENIQREDLNPIDKARGFRKILDEYGMTQQDLADKMGS